MSESILTHEYLKSILHYSIITGDFYYLKPVNNRVKTGDVAGSLDSSHYVQIGINYSLYKSHRLAWFWVTGEWPKHQIDHKNGVRNANYWLNLREATHSQNQCNTSTYSNNTSGYKGVYWHKARQKWQTYINLNKKRKHLGLFDDIEAAYAERLKAEKELHRDFARVI